MKKGVLVAGLIVTEAFGPRLGNAVEFPRGALQLTSAVLGPIARQVSERVMENVLDRLLTQLGDTSAAPVEWTGEAFGIIVRAIAEQKDNCLTMSITDYLVRRTVESGIEAAHAGAA